MFKHINKKRKNRFIFNIDEEIKLKNPHRSYIKFKKRKIKFFQKPFFYFSFPRKIILPITIVIIYYIISNILRKFNSSSKKIIKNKIIINENEENKINLTVINNLIREEELKKGRIYLNKCLEKEKNNEKNFILYKETSISVIIPIHNSQEIIESVIRSIQYQNMIDIEIIIVNDYSTDSSSFLIEEMMKQDPRIILINNNKNMGALYSRCIGVLKSRGKYIINLDHDDLFLSEDLFNYVYNEAEEGHFDIISFLDVQGSNYNVSIDDMKDGRLTNHPDNLTIYQPELSVYLMFKNESFAYVDTRIWGKLIKTKIYKNAVNLLGEERYSFYNNINEDIIGLFAICSQSESYKFIRKYGIFHLVKNSMTPNYNREELMYLNIFFSDIIFDLSINDNKKYAAFILINTKSSWFFSISEEKIKTYLSKVLKKIIYCEYVDEKYKRKIIKLYQEYDLLK